LNEVGNVLWHSLDKQGKISVYDVEWPSSGIQTNIPAHMLEAVRVTEHENESEKHGVQDEKMEISERRYKRKK